MSLSGNNSPNRVLFSEPRPSFEILSGTVVEEVAPAIELTRRLVLAWNSGLRDLQNTRLAAFYQETPRSRVSTQDIEARYADILAIAEELQIQPVSQAEFVRLFLPSAGQTTFVDIMLRIGYELEFQNDFVDLENEVLGYENPSMPVLTGERETATRVLNPSAVAALLEQLNRPSLVTTTQHFVDDYPENDAIDTDAKAHERIFLTLADYIRRMLLLKV